MFAYIIAILHFIGLVGRLEASMDRLQPGRDHHLLALVTAQVAFGEPAMAGGAFAGPLGSAALLEANARHESSFGAQTRGDGGHSFGIGQIWGRPDLEHDDAGNLRESLRQTRVSFEMNPKCPFCGYLTGKPDAGEHVRWQSKKRVELAKQILVELSR